MSVMQSVGSFLGTTAAYAVEGTRLGTTQLAIGAREGYTATAEELRAKREALRAQVGVEPTAQTQRKLRAKAVA